MLARSVLPMALCLCDCVCLSPLGVRPLHCVLGYGNVGLTYRAGWCIDRLYREQLIKLWQSCRSRALPNLTHILKNICVTRLFGDLWPWVISVDWVKLSLKEIIIAYLRKRCDGIMPTNRAIPLMIWPIEWRDFRLLRGLQSQKWRPLHVRHQLLWQTTVTTAHSDLRLLCAI